MHHRKHNHGYEYGLYLRFPGVNDSTEWDMYKTMYNTEWDKYKTKGPQPLQSAMQVGAA